MQKTHNSKIHLLLEEIKTEIKAVEKRNRELYASAIDIEDEELSLKIQNESYTALRNMKGLKSAMETFRVQLESSGILNRDFSSEIDTPKIDTREGGEIFISHEHSPIVVLTDDEESDLVPDKEEEEDKEDEEESIISEPPQAVYINEDLSKDIGGEVSGIIGELSKAMGEINDISDISDDSDDNDDNDDDDLVSSLEDLSDDFDDLSEDLVSSLDDLAETLGDLVDDFEDNLDEDPDEDLDDMDDELAAVARVEAEREKEREDDSDKSLDSFEDDFSFDFDDGIVFDEIEFAKQDDDDIEEAEEIEKVQEIEEIIKVPEVEEPVSELKEESIEMVRPVEIAPMPIPAPVPVKEDDDFSGFGMTSGEVGIYSSRTPAKFSMFGRRVDVRDWADMLVKVCEILILKNPYTVAQFDKYHDLNPLGNTYFSYSQGEIANVAKKLSNGLWIELQRTPDDIVMLCKKVLELCGYPRSELEIEFAD